MFPGRVGDASVVAAGLPSLLEQMALAEINTPPRIAAFLATLAHESRLLYNIPQAGATSTYKGRGYIQLTGSPNYASAGAALGVDLTSSPELALSLDWSAKIARWYWTVARHCNPMADALQMGKVCAAIGYPLGDGSEDLRRTASFAAALKCLTGSVPDGISSTRSPQAVAWSSAEKLGQLSVDGYLVNNNVFSPEAGTQTIHASGPGSWYVVADHSKAGAPPGSIKSYPDTQRNFTNRPIDSFTHIIADYSMTCPPVGEWDAAFDVWIGGIGSKSTAEVMVWTHHRYNGPLPPKNALESTTVMIDGQGFTAWRRKNGNGGDYIALVMTPMKPAGSVDLLAVFRWLISKGWLKGTDLVAAVEFGVEIANTAGGPQTFTLNSYTLTTK